MKAFSSRPSRKGAVALILLICLQLSIIPVSALKHTFQTHKDSRFFIGPIGAPYGFLAGGEFSLKIFDFEVYSSKHHSKTGEKDINQDLNGLHPGFLLKRFDTESDFTRYEDMILDDPSICAFQSFMKEMDMEDDITKPEDQKRLNIIDGGAEGIFVSMDNVEKMWKTNVPSVTHNFSLDEAGYYFLIYQICITSPKDVLFKEIRSSFELDLTHKNVDRFGKTSYLTAGEMPLPHLFLYFSVSYFILAVFWIKNVQSVVSGKDSAFGTVESGKPTVYAIHHLMSAVLVLKTLSILFESIRYHYIRVNGHAEIWSFAYYSITFVKGVFLFFVLLLLGTGWSMFKSFLSKNDRRIIFCVLFLQVVDNIALVVLNSETQGERLYNDWSAILHLFDILCCCAVLIPIVWQVNALEESVENESTKDSETARTLAKLQLFRRFYILAIGYIYFTRIIVYLFAATLKYEHTWMQYALTEIGTLAFYATVGIQFRPVLENNYDEVNLDEESAETQNQTSTSIEMVPETGKHDKK